jgi:hypothetical protein
MKQTVFKRKFDLAQKRGNYVSVSGEDYTFRCDHFQIPYEMVTASESAAFADLFWSNNWVGRVRLSSVEKVE